ncbi:response regulator [Flavobacterium sp. J49]|uniref:response regulator n=1 Tax=Flavobacterium sp. J49 TaxID=2718534 RepID=UPI0015938B62|nr:response regulator [Flavobacterium sp. J49]MBF6642192.1 response regulator [Flavobacterium sp. J49]NIC03439.1 response regulator [Flavobacterium sp. J49]
MKKTLKILLIEDDTIEVMKFIKVIETLGEKHQIIESKNGEEAMDILKITKQLPDIIVLDLNMPKVNGVEFLSSLKEDEILKYIPAIVLTTSYNPKDITECYKIGIAGYILKPLKYEDYVSRIKKVLEYWCENVLIKA